MKTISVFDVIGPNMIGPSSSHTAGAVRIARLARALAGGSINQVSFMLYGSFANTHEGHGTDYALVGGILGYDTEDPRIRDSFRMAEEAGIRFRFEERPDADVDHPNTVDIVMTTTDGAVMSVTGVSTGGGNAVIARIDGVPVDLTGEYCTLFIHQEDRPGIVAHITNALSKLDINIAQMKLYRSGKGKDAYVIIETDGDIPEEILVELYDNINIHRARIIRV